MMRGMFAAISGLKQHQVMLDVTANDIANVNTIGYKSARVTFAGLADPAAARRGRRDDGHRRLQRRAGRPRRRPRLDRQPDDRRRTSDDRQPARRRDPGRRLLPDRRRASRPATSRRSPPTSYTRAGNFSISTEGYLTTQTGQYVIGYAPAGTAADPDRRRDPDPDRRHRRRHRPVRRRVLRRPGHAAPASPRTASRWRRSRTPPASSARAATSGSSRPTRARRPSARRASTAWAPRTPARSRCPTSTSSQTFTNMITAQRGFQANSRVISTADSMLEELVNLKR